MLLGDLELSTISGGRFRIDGGTMFGVVPKALWERTITPAADNTIPQATHCVLVRGGGRVVLIDTGYGAKLPEKSLRVLAATPGPVLRESLAAVGVGVDDVTTVVLSHLHFDHAGGATEFDERGELRTTFPNAEYVAQRAEWELATAELPELRGAYPQENLLPLADNGQLRLIEGEVEIVPGVHSLLTPGHTSGHQSILVESGGAGAVFLGDLCPTWRHLPTLWCMGYDTTMIETRRQKPRLLRRIVDEGWLALSDHDPDHAAARLRDDPRRDFAVEGSWETL